MLNWTQHSHIRNQHPCTRVIAICAPLAVPSAIQNLRLSLSSSISPWGTIFNKPFLYNFSYSGLQCPVLLPDASDICFLLVSWTFIFTVATCGCETWTITRTLAKRIASFEMKCYSEYHGQRKRQTLKLN